MAQRDKRHFNQSRGSVQPKTKRSTRPLMHTWYDICKEDNRERTGRVSLREGCEVNGRLTSERHAIASKNQQREEPGRAGPGPTEPPLSPFPIRCHFYFDPPPMAWRARRRLIGPAAFRALSPALLAAATARTSDPKRRCKTSKAPIMTNASVLIKRNII